MGYTEGDLTVHRSALHRLSLICNGPCTFALIHNCGFSLQCYSEYRRNRIHQVCKGPWSNYQSNLMPDWGKKLKM